MSVSAHRDDAHQGKVTTAHLKRTAYLYVRQSTLRQVLENTESTRRQYSLKDRAIALGWHEDRIVVIDSDLGQSGGTATDRAGFQRLVAEVGMGLAGIVMGLEVSRLARNNTDWHHLLEICGLTGTLILDEDGIYDPRRFNDRLLLGLKGTMSEAELHILRARLQGGIESLARRGELRAPLPSGFVYTAEGRVALHPDLQVRQAIQLLFNTFQRTGSACATVKFFRDQRLQFPARRCGSRDEDVRWVPLNHGRAIRALKNPRYAGAFFFGSTQTRRTVDGRSRTTRLARDQWYSLIRDVHPGYITWEQHEQNLARLRDNNPTSGKNPVREGPALLQGLIVCGVCGARMGVRYHTRRGRLIPDYVCVAEQREGGPYCQCITGDGIDAAIGTLLLEAVTPMALEVALSVHRELALRSEEADRLRLQKVERARYEAGLAQRRYLSVDPDNRLVADVLEAEWNTALQAVAEAQAEYQRQQSVQSELDEQQRRDILALATDFPRLWKDDRTPDRERKRMVRLMLEDVTVTKREHLILQIRFKGGACQELEIPRPKLAAELRRTAPSIMQEIERLSSHHTEREIARILNDRGLRTSSGEPFQATNLRALMKRHGIATTCTRLRNQGMMTVEEVAERLDISKRTVDDWKRRGLLKAHYYNERSYLVEPPDEYLPAKGAHKNRRGPQTST